LIFSTSGYHLDADVVEADAHNHNKGDEITRTKTKGRRRRKRRGGGGGKEEDETEEQQDIIKKMRPEARTARFTLTFSTPEGSPLESNPS